MDQTPIAFRGDTPTCFAHFGRQFYKHHEPAKKGTDAAKQPLARFCGTSTDTVTRWLNENSFPSGEIRFRLMCFLEVQGYMVSELLKLPASSRLILELIGYSLITGEEATKKISYPQTAQLFRVLRGEAELIKERRDRAEQLIKTHRKALEQRKASLKANPPYRFGASIGVPIQHRMILSTMEMLMMLMQQDIPAHEAQDLRTRLGDLPNELQGNLRDFINRLERRG